MIIFSDFSMDLVYTICYYFIICSLYFLNKSFFFRKMNGGAKMAGTNTINIEKILFYII